MHREGHRGCIWSIVPRRPTCIARIRRASLSARAAQLRLQNHPRRQHLHQSQSAVAIRGAVGRGRLRAVVTPAGEHGEPPSPIHPQPGAGCGGGVSSEPKTLNRLPSSARSTLGKRRVTQSGAGKDIAVVAGHQNRTVGRHRLYCALPSQLQTVPHGVVQDLVDRGAVGVTLVRKAWSRMEPWAVWAHGAMSSWATAARRSPPRAPASSG